MYTAGVLVWSIGYPYMTSRCLGCHGSKVEVRVERLKQGNIEIRATIFSISMYFWTKNRSTMVSCTA